MTLFVFQMVATMSSIQAMFEQNFRAKWSLWAALGAGCLVRLIYQFFELSGDSCGANLGSFAVLGTLPTAKAINLKVCRGFKFNTFVCN
jgi:hypothetical protein